MSKLIHELGGQIVKPSERLTIAERDLTYRWHYDPTDLSPAGTVYVSDDTGRVSHFRADQYGLRVVGDDYIAPSRKRRVRTAA